MDVFEMWLCTYVKKKKKKEVLILIRQIFLHKLMRMLL